MMFICYRLYWSENKLFDKRKEWSEKSQREFCHFSTLSDYSAYRVLYNKDYLGTDTEGTKTLINVYIKSRLQYIAWNVIILTECIYDLSSVLSHAKGLNELRALNVLSKAYI